MFQRLADWLFANLDVIGKIVGIATAFITGVSTVWLWLRTDIKRHRAKIASLEADIADEKAKKRKLSKQVQEWHDAFEAAQREIKEATLKGVLDRYDRKRSQHEPDAAAEVLRDFFTRERQTLARAAGELGGWYCDEGGGAVQTEFAASSLPPSAPLNRSA